MRPINVSASLKCHDWHRLHSQSHFIDITNTDWASVVNCPLTLIGVLLFIAGL